MLIDLVESIIYILCILPFILISIDKSVKGKLKLLLLLVFYFLTLQFLLLLPINFLELDFIPGKWNWSGKIYAIVMSILFYQFFKHTFKNHHYIKFSQSHQSFKKVRLIFTLILFYAIIEGLIFYNKSWDLETILFQATMPGIDEEIAFRGILLGLLSTLLLDKTKVLSKITINPSIWIIGILFGLIHALQLNSDWQLTFNFIYFVKTFLLGTMWSWMTLKTKSILLPMISHNLANLIPNLIGMLK